MRQSFNRSFPFTVLIACVTALVCLSPNALAHSDDDSHNHEAEKAAIFIPLNLGSTTSESSGKAASATAIAVRFGIVGDVQGNAHTADLSDDMATKNLDLVLYPGDLVGNGANNGSDSWVAWNNNTKNRGFDRYMVAGNHDLGSASDATDADWQQMFSWLPDSQTVDGPNGPQTGLDQLDYFFDVGNTRFISITTDSSVTGSGHKNGSRQDAQALPWLENVLNDPNTKSKDHVFIMTHHPITFDNYDGSGGVDGSFWQVMVNSGAPIRGMIAGHWHQYQPGQPDPYNQDIWELILGTGNQGFSGYGWQNKIGFTVIDVNGAEVTGEFYGDASGQDGPYTDLLDSFAVASSTPPATGLVARYDFSNGGANLDTAPAGGPYSPLGKGNNGDYNGGASVTGGQLVLDGTNDFATGYGIGDYNMCIMRNLSIQIKVVVDNLGSGTEDNTLVSYTGDVGYGTAAEEIVNQPYNLRIRDDYKLVMMWEYNHGTKKELVSTVGATALNDGFQHALQVTRDADNGEVRFYVDGAQLGTAVSFNKLTELPTGGQQGYLRIGCNFNGGETGFFDGKIDNVKIWNSLTPTADAVVLEGDFDDDDDIDGDDWLAFLAGLGTDLSGMTQEQAYALGDITGDLVTDYQDFEIFKPAYQQHNGSARPAARSTSIESQAMASANLNINLVANPGFENVDLGTLIGSYNLPQIDDWVYCYAQDHSVGGWANNSSAHSA